MPKRTNITKILVIALDSTIIHKHVNVNISVHGLPLAKRSGL